MNFVGTFANWRRLIENSKNTKPKWSFFERENFKKGWLSPKKFRNYFNKRSEDP